MIEENGVHRIREDSKVFQVGKGYHSSGRNIGGFWYRITELDIPEMMGIFEEVEKLCDGDCVLRDMEKVECGKT